MKEKIEKIIYKFLPLKNRIIFESNPEFSCNALPVYEEMVRRGIRDKYEIYWLVENKNKYIGDTSGNKYLDYVEHGIRKIQKKYILATSKVLIFTNRFLNKYKENQVAINLMHGCPLKMTWGYVEHDTCDYVVSLAEIFNGVISKQLDVPMEKIVSLGFPRNDVFQNNYQSLKHMGFKNNEKMIVWMPTFRKNKNSNVSYGDVREFGVPLLDSIEKFAEINHILQQNKIVLVIKLHPAEDTKQITTENYSNIVFISDLELNTKSLTAYKLLADSDALITDYSSVYYDYLLTNKPIGLVIDDLNEYSKKNGFWYGEYKSFIKGQYIETYEDFISFVNELSRGIDSSKKEREMARSWYCQYQDYKATKRVVDFIMKQL